MSGCLYDRRQSSGNAFYVMTYAEVDFEGRGKRKRKTPTRYEGTIEVVGWWRLVRSRWRRGARIMRMQR